MSTLPTLTGPSLSRDVQPSVLAFMAVDGALNRVPECRIFADRPTGSRTNARGAVRCEQEGLMARCVEKARGAVLVHDEMGRNQSLCNRIHRQPQPFQRVCSQQSRGVVLSEHDESDVAGPTDCRPGPPNVHFYPATVGEQEDAFVHRLDAQLAEQAGGQRGVGCAGVHRRFDLLPLLAVMLDMRSGHFKVHIGKPLHHRFMRPHLTSFGAPVIGPAPLDTGIPVSPL